MRRPSAQVMVFGHPLVTLAAVLAFLWVAYRWWLGLVEPAAPLVMLLVASGCAAANTCYENYRAWKREWDIMGGKPAPRRPNLAALRVVLAVVIWIVMAIAVRDWMSHPQYRWVALLFWAGTGVGVLALLVGLWRRCRPRRRGIAVSVCLPLPLRSPGLRKAYAALPDHCRVLMPRS